MTRGSADALAAILAALAGPGVRIAIASGSVPNGPGLYAIHGDPSVWIALGLGEPPDLRPLYVGKSESSLRDRDLRQHFADGRTGSSTLRRSFAALLHERLKVRGVPRNLRNPESFSNYGLSPADDAKLTGWMMEKLAIATWPWTGSLPLASQEARVLLDLEPPLNLSGVTTEWSSHLRARRAVLAAEARVWRQR